MTKNSTPTISRIGRRLTSRDNQPLLLVTLVVNELPEPAPVFEVSLSKIDRLASAGNEVLIFFLPSTGDFRSSWSCCSLSLIVALVKLPLSICAYATEVLTDLYSKHPATT